MLSEKEYQADAHWFPDGKRMIFGRTPSIPGSSEKVALQVLDLSSKQVSVFPGSENLYGPRLSPDGKRLAAVTSDNKKLLIFDSQSQKWTDWVSEPGGDNFAYLVARRAIHLLRQPLECPWISPGQSGTNPL